MRRLYLAAIAMLMFIALIAWQRAVATESTAKALRDVVHEQIEMIRFYRSEAIRERAQQWNRRSLER